MDLGHGYSPGRLRSPHSSSSRSAATLIPRGSPERDFGLPTQACRLRPARVLFYAQAVAGLSPTRATRPSRWRCSSVLAPLRGYASSTAMRRRQTSRQALVVVEMMTTSAPACALIVMGVGMAFIWSPLAATARRRLPPGGSGVAWRGRPDRWLSSAGPRSTSRISAEMPRWRRAVRKNITELPDVLQVPRSSAGAPALPRSSLLSVVWRVRASSVRCVLQVAITLTFSRHLHRWTRTGRIGAAAGGPFLGRPQVPVDEATPPTCASNTRRRGRRPRLMTLFVDDGGHAVHAGATAAFDVFDGFSSSSTTRTGSRPVRRRAPGSLVTRPARPTRSCSTVGVRPVASS